jgi:hypothetical protein
MTGSHAAGAPSSRKLTFLAAGVVVASVLAFAGYHVLAGQEGGGTADACRGGLISYSKDVVKSSNETGGAVDVDLAKLKAKLNDAAKRSREYEEVVTTDPEALRAAHACLQVCQAWATTRGGEREALFGDFRSCLKRPSVATSATAAPTAVLQPTTVLSAGNDAVQIVGSQNNVNKGAPAPLPTKK